MKIKNMYFTKKFFLCLSIFSLLLTISTSFTFECGVIKQAEDLLAQQILFNGSLQVIESLQDKMNEDIESMIDLLTVDKSIDLSYKSSAKIPTKNSSAENLLAAITNLRTTNDILFDVNKNQVTSAGQLTTILTSQLNSVDNLGQMHSKMDKIIDLLGTSTQLAVNLGISLSDCEASLGDCCKGLELLDDYLNDIEVSPDDVFWTYFTGE